jgi:hypothetical protein
MASPFSAVQDSEERALSPLQRGRLGTEALCPILRLADPEGDPAAVELEPHKVHGCFLRGARGEARQLRSTSY